MKWIVDWDPDPEKELVDWWVTRANRKEITRAADNIEDILSINPLKYGKELAEGLFFLKVPPLIAYFEIHVQEKKVEITAIGLIEE